MIIVSEVFKSLGQPTVTYVHRESGRYERLLKSAIQDKGQLCLLTGPSKTGKTSLYKKVLDEQGILPITIRCNAQLVPEQFWRLALEAVSFERIASHTKGKSIEVNAEGKLSGSIGWKWLAGLLGEVSFGIKSTTSESEVREKILANPSSNHLIPILKIFPVILVVEDFHYLSDESQKVIFQQWKSFVDEGVSVIVVGTTHHAIDIASANSDLLGRIYQIEITQWSTKDLKEIINLGMKHFGISEIPVNLSLSGNTIAKEAAGLPIICQQAGAQVLFDLGFTEIDQNIFGQSIAPKITDALVYKSLHNVARTRYSQLEQQYAQLAAGPRKRARKYDTYEIVLSCFTFEPLKFSLMRHEIEERIGKLPLPSNQKPPAASINSTLKALSRFQEKRKIEIIEWREQYKTLYILEPSFLFYLRWRKERPKPPTFRELLAELGNLFVSPALSRYLDQASSVQLKLK